MRCSQQHVNGAGATVFRARRAKRKRLIMAAQPAADLMPDGRPALRRAQTLAMDHAHAAFTLRPTAVEKSAEGCIGLREGVSMQVELALYGKLSASQLAKYPVLQARPAIRQFPVVAAHCRRWRAPDGLMRWRWRRNRSRGLLWRSRVGLEGFELAYGAAKLLNIGVGKLGAHAALL